MNSLPAVREEYGGLLSGDIEGSEIPAIRSTTFAYNVTFMRILAASYYSWMLDHDSWEALAKFHS